MSFPAALLKNLNIWVKCKTGDQVAELSRWARPGRVCVPSAWMKGPHEYYYFNVARDEISRNAPAPMSTIIAFEDIDRSTGWKVGDKVFCDMMGEGDVIDVSPLGRFKVLFGWACTVTFRQDGTVYGVNGPCKPCLTRVERPVDWSAVKPGTEFVVWGPDGTEVGERVFRFFAEGKPWFGSTDASVHSWPKYQAAAE